MLKLSCLITGDEYKNVENETAMSKKKIRLYAVSLMIPVMIWAVCSFLLSSQVLKCDINVSIIIMIISSLLIFIIEKVIIMSNGTKTMAVIRILLGLIISILGALAFDQVIFKNDIDTQMFENKEEYVRQSVNSKENDLKNEFSVLENTINRNELHWKEAYESAVREYDGTGGSGIRGNGTRTSLKMQKANDLKTELDNSRTELNNKQTKIDSVLSAFEIQSAQSYNENSLLLRIKAFYDLVNKDGWMKLTYLLFTLFIIILESMVIMVKMFSKETNYERRLKLIEELGERRMKRLLEKNSNNFDTKIFRDDLMESSELLKRPLNGILR